MAGTVFTDLAFFTGLTGGSTSNCDATTDWSGAPTLDTETKVEGTGAMSKKVSNTTSIHVFTLASAVDLSNTQLYVWAMCASIGVLATKVAGGFRIRIEDAAANWGEWYMAGKDTWGGSWDCFMIHTTTTADYYTSATPPNKAAITKVGVVFTTTAAVAKINSWWDGLRYGTYLGIKAGTDVSPATFTDFKSAEDTNAYGAIIVSEGVYQVQSKLYFGSTTSGEATYFKDTSKVIVFRDRAVPADFYEMTIQGNATAETKVYFGTKSGEAGISGCVIRSVGTAKFKFTATDTNITNLGVYGCSFFDASTISLPAYSVNKEVLNTTFEMGAEVLADTCIVKNCNFISADNRGVRMISASHNITDCKFINCVHGVHCNFSTAVDFNNLVFSGSNGTDKWDIEHSVAGTLTVNKLGTSNPSYVDETGGGSTTIAGSVPLTVKVIETDGDPIELAQVAIYRTSDDQELMNMDTNASGIASGSYTGSTPASIYVRVRKSSTGATKYIPVSGVGTIESSTGYSATFTLYVDPNV